MNWDGWIQGTPMCVDNFGFHKGVFVYFLTHMHADHTTGLCHDWNLGIIYCSAISKRLLQQKFRISDDYISVVEVGRDLRLPLDQYDQEDCLMHVVDANHAPGAVMFYLEGYFGRILLTGDFRLHPSMLDMTFMCGLDLLVLDETFLDPDCDFPPQDEVLDEISGIVTAYPADTQFVIGIDTLGKEELLIRLSDALQSLVMVDEQRYEQCKLIGMADIVTMNAEESRLIVWRRQQVSRDRVRQLATETGMRTVALVPSGWSYAANERPKLLPTLPGVCTTDMAPSTTIEFSLLENSSLVNEPEYVIHRVPYSIHSSYSEIRTLVKFLQPKFVVGLTRPASEIRTRLSDCLPLHSTIAESIESVWDRIRLAIPNPVMGCMLYRDEGMRMTLKDLRGAKPEKKNKRAAKIRRTSIMKFASPVQSDKKSRPHEHQQVITTDGSRPELQPQLEWTMSLEEDVQILRRLADDCAEARTSAEVVPENDLDSSSEEDDFLEPCGPSRRDVTDASIQTQQPSFLQWFTSRPDGAKPPTRT